MKTLKNKLVLTGSLALGAGLLFAGAASAAPYCPTGESFFGTIRSVNGQMLTVTTPSGRNADVRIDNNARINADGGSLRPGTYIGAYGCATPNGVFHASEVSIAASQARYHEHLGGVVREIGTDGRLIVSEGYGRTGTWFVPDTGDFRVGQRIDAYGMLGPNGAFYPQSIDGRSTAYDADDTSGSRSRTITLNGTIRQVRANQILVWEPAYGTTGTWIFADTGRFRVGERVSGTGTEDRSGRFYVRHITIL